MQHLRLYQTKVHDVDELTQGMSGVAWSKTSSVRVFVVKDDV